MRWRHSRDGVTVRSGGVAMVNVQITSQSQRDLLLMESIAIPFSFLVLVWVFGGLLAAALPVAVGVIAILGSLSVLRLITFGTDVSIFALNLTTAMGLALAIDYTLLIISRFRDELAGGADRDDRAGPHDGDRRAHGAVLGDDGRAVDGGAGPVPHALPEVVRLRGCRDRRLRRSRGGGGDACGDRSAGGPTGLAGRAPAGPACAEPARPGPPPRRAAILVPLNEVRDGPRRSDRTRRHRAAPGARCTVPRESGGDFPTTACCRAPLSAHQVGDQLRNDFVNNSDTAVTVVVPDAHGLAPADLERYAAALSRVPDVTQVSAPTGTFVDGARGGPACGGHRGGARAAHS